MEMGKRISATRSFRRARRGFTLVEAMFASVLLAVTVVAISGAISASYAQDHYAEQRRLALLSGSQLLNEVTSLPIDGATATDPSIMKYNNYTDEAAIQDLTSVVGGTVAATAAEDAKSATRTINVDRKVSLNGTASATGDFTVVGVSVENARQNVTLKRLVTSAESAAVR